MAATSNATLLADLIDPQVFADFIDTKMVDAIKLSPLAIIDDTLVGRPGDELTMPSYNYVGDAVPVEEGEDIPISKLSTSTDRVRVEKIGRAIEFSDEAVLSAFHNADGSRSIVNEAADQILTSINSGVENTLLANMGSKVLPEYTANIAASDDPADGIADALVSFGEDIDGDKVLLIPPPFYATLRKSKSWIPNTESGANIIINGRIGMIHGCQVVYMDRLMKDAVRYTKTLDKSVDATKTYYRKSGAAFSAVDAPNDDEIGSYYEKEASNASTAYIVKPGALRIVMKRDTLVEYDRDILSEMNFIKASKLFAPYVYDKTKVIRINILP